jgi:hypothetical protein
MTGQCLPPLTGALPPTGWLREMMIDVEHCRIYECAGTIIEESTEHAEFADVVDRWRIPLGNKGKYDKMMNETGHTWTPLSYLLDIRHLRLLLDLLVLLIVKSTLSPFHGRLLCEKYINT